MSEYWKSTVGIQQRMNMIGDSFTFNVVNNTIQFYGETNGVKELEWVGETDERTCDYCDSQNGRHYKIGQFLPELPHHVFCRCSWRMIT